MSSLLQAPAEAPRQGEALRTIALSATFTAEPLAEVVELWMKELDLPARVAVAPYHQVFQQLLDPGSVLSRNRRGANVVLVRFEDWARYQERGALGDPESLAMIERSASELTSALEAAARAMAAPLLVFVCPCSPAAAAVEPFRILHAGLEERLVASLGGVANLHLVPAGELTALYPVEQLHDPYADQIGHIPYSPAGFAALGTLVARKFHALSSPPAKVIVLDCDQTLWRGVCGEDGPERVVLDAPRRRLQEIVLAQRQAGMLLCLCSKNQEEDVWCTFDRRADFPLERRHLTAWRINWLPKSENLRSLAAELSLGLDSFVFIDDNPVECAEVRANCPQVMVLELPADVERIPRVLEHFWAFDRLRTTAEDRERPELYRQMLERERHRQSAGSFEDFLAGLGLVVEIQPLAPENLERAAQLTQRTNQFNASTIRRTEGEIQRLLADGALEGRVISVHDRFGDYGLVGVVFFAARPPALEVDTFLLSCRVLGRGVEHRILSELAREAEERGLSRLDVRAVPTARNRPAFDFLRGIPGAVEDAAAGIIHLPAAPVAMTRGTLEPEEAAEAPVPAPSGPVVSRSGLLMRIAAELSDPREIQRRVAAARAGQHRAVATAYVPPRGPVEEALACIVAEVIGAERVGADDDFFDLGLHSLLATQATSRVRDVFGAELSLRIFYEARTLAGLAAAIESHGAEGRAPARPSIASFRQDRSAPTPLSFAQERFWAGRRREARTVASTIPMLWLFEGRLDLSCLEGALREVVARHEVLRTSFQEGPEEPVQVVHPEISLRLPVVDLERVDPRERMAEIRLWSTLDGRTHFDLERGPLFRLTLFRCSERESVLLFTVHHGAFDGWSDSILIGELSALYNAFLEDRPSPLPPLAAQYQDFARWQRQVLSGEALEEEVAFWREHLQGAEPVDLRGGRPLPAPLTFEAGIEPFTISEELERKLEAFAAANGATLFMTLLAAFKALLHQESGRDDLVVTCLFANRNQVEIEGLIGNFFAALPLRTRLAGAGSFRELLARVRAVTLGAHEHPDFLPELMMRGLSFLKEGETGGPTTFRVLFQLAKLPPTGQGWSGLEVTRLPFDTGKIRQDLSLFFTQSGRLSGRFKYNRDIFERMRVFHMRQRFLHLLETVVEAPERPLDQLFAPERTR